MSGPAARTASLACSRGSTQSVGIAGSRCARSKAGMVSRFEMARAWTTGSVAVSVPEVSSTQASAASAIRNDDQYGSSVPA